MSEKRKIAFIGTGLMGAPMAGHLLDAGYPVTVYNRTKAKADKLVERGAVWANSPAEACKDADVTITIVGYPKDVEEVYMGKDGLIANAKPGSILIDMSTSSPTLAKDINKAAAERDIYAFDAPVTGGEKGAIDGTLTIMVGADEEGLAKVQDIFDTFGKVIIPFGEAGLGQMAKIANQIGIAGNMVTMAESLAFAKHNGIEPEKILPVLESGTAGSVAYSQYAHMAIEGNFNPGFMVQHLRKDLGIALTIGDDEDLTLPVTENAYNLYDLLYNIGGESRGTQAITLIYEDDETCKKQGLDWGLLDEMYDQYFDDADLYDDDDEDDEDFDDEDFDDDEECNDPECGCHRHKHKAHGKHKGCCEDMSKEEKKAKKAAKKEALKAEKKKEAKKEAKKAEKKAKKKAEKKAEKKDKKKDKKDKK